MRVYPSRRPEERHGLTMDFATDANVESGATIVSATVTVEVWENSDATDPSPAQVLSGTPIIDGTIVQQFETGGLIGVTYVTNFTVALSNGETVTQQGRQTVSDFV